MPPCEPVTPFSPPAMATTTTPPPAAVRLKRHAHFVDFDQPTEFEILEMWSESLDSRNFVLDFDNTSARCARDLDHAAMAEVLRERRQQQQSQNHRHRHGHQAAAAAATAVPASPRSPNLEPPLAEEERGGNGQPATATVEAVNSTSNPDLNANTSSGAGLSGSGTVPDGHVPATSPQLHQQQAQQQQTAATEATAASNSERRHSTRWINVWAPEEQRAVVRRIGRHYGFSARLLASMCCGQARAAAGGDGVADAASHGQHRTVSDLVNDFMQPWRSAAQTARRSREKRMRPMSARQTSAVANALVKETEQDDDGDVDGSAAAAVAAATAPPPPQPPPRGGLMAGFGSGDHRRRSYRKDKREKDVDGGINGAIGATGTGLELDHYRLVNDVWHFSSIDWGANYLCIGFNSLYRVDREINVDSYRPAGKRVWTWLVLCADGTVVSIHENPYPGLHEPLQQHQRKTVLAIRRNLRNIFKQLSRGFNDTNLQNVLEVVKLRSGLPTARQNVPQRRPGDPNNDSDSSDYDDGNGDDDDDDSIYSGKGPLVYESDAPSLLFYYLFDDWFTSYSLVARREHQYGVELDALRDRMFHRAELEHVSRLHHYGRQLAVLRRIYASYSTIIQRILDGPQGQVQNQLQHQRHRDTRYRHHHHNYNRRHGRHDDHDNYDGAGTRLGADLAASSYAAMPGDVGVDVGSTGSWWSQKHAGQQMGASTMTGVSSMGGGGTDGMTDTGRGEGGGGGGGAGSIHNSMGMSAMSPVIDTSVATLDQRVRQVNNEDDDDYSYDDDNSGRSYQRRRRPSPPSYGVTIALAASTRFRRLRDRINMYAIGEIQDCQEEKNALMELNFNLITLKESSYIEGLTRITILLAKVTILFIPVSFITAYFTVEFDDGSGSGTSIAYSPRQYWAAFAVVLAVTVAGLALFGSLSGTQEGKPIYESFTKVFFKGWNGLWRKQHRHQQQGQGQQGQQHHRAGHPGMTPGAGGVDDDDNEEQQDERKLDRDPALKLQALSRTKAG